MSPRVLVLVGGGHAHAHVLAAFGRRPEPGVQVTLVSRERHTIYSGMLPGHVAGTYTRAESQIDMAHLAERSGARFVEAEIDGLDPDRKAVLSGGRSVARYDLLSLDTGSVTALVAPGAARHGLPVRPIPDFLAGWEAMSAGVGRRRIVVVGAGLGGIELSLAMRAGWRGAAPPALTLLGGAVLAPEWNARARALLAAALHRRGIAVVENAPVAEVGPDALITADGRQVGYDHLVWATGAAAPAWLGGTGLALDGRGFLAVEATLRAAGHADIFAAGDVAGVAAHPRPKAGVFAVRQGPPLADNLRRALRGEEPLAFTPQRAALALIGTGDGRAVAARGGLAAEGRWVWWLKRRIDRGWIARYQV